MTVNFVVVSDLKYVWNVIISICSKALRQVIGRMSSKFSKVTSIILRNWGILI